MGDTPSCWDRQYTLEMRQERPRERLATVTFGWRVGKPAMFQHYLFQDNFDFDESLKVRTYIAW